MGIHLFSCKKLTTDKIELKTIQRNPNSISTSSINEKYHLSNTNDGYIQSAKLSNPLKSTAENIQSGQKLFIEYCSHCHGKNGNAEAPMIQENKYPPPPPFNKRLPMIADGQIFHSIYYGKNQMPDNQNDLTIKQIWQIVTHINTLRNAITDEK